MLSMLIFGTANTVVMKAQDDTCVNKDEDGNCKDKVVFNHPYFQTANMFVGEMSCLLVYVIKKYAFKR